MRAYYFIKGILYIDKKGREILHIPGNFIVINYIRREPEVIFDFRRLKRWARNWNTGKASLREFIGNPEVEQSELDEIFDTYLEGRTAEAEGYCVDLFDAVVNRVYGINSENRRRKCQ